MQKEQELNHIADLIRNNMTTEESSQQQQQQQHQPQQQQQQTGENMNLSNVVPSHKSTFIVGLAPGSSIDWKGITFASDTSGSSSSKTAITSTTNTSASSSTNTQGSSSSTTTSTVAMTETQNESTNINGLTSNLKQMTLSPKTVSFSLFS